MILLIRFFPGFGGGRTEVLNLDVDGHETVIYSFQTTCSDSRTEDLRSAIQTFLDAGVKKAILDLVHVDHWGLEGVRHLLSLWQELEAAGGEAVITNVSSQMENVFQVCKLTRVFKVVDSIEEAIAALG